MKHVICAAILALFAPITALSATAQLEETSDERVALPLPLSNSNAYAFRLEQADQQAMNVLHHDLSGLVCPYIIDNHALTKITQFSHSGHDVACGYNSQEANSYITIYMSRYGEDATPSAMMENAAIQLDGSLHCGQLTRCETNRIALRGCSATVPAAPIRNHGRYHTAQERYLDLQYRWLGPQSSRNLDWQ